LKTHLLLVEREREREREKRRESWGEGLSRKYIFGVEGSQVVPASPIRGIHMIRINSKLNSYGFRGAEWEPSLFRH
jgi:hypothetical protein